LVFQIYANPALITDEVLANSKFLINMNFIDYAFSLYESGFAQKISDFALGASRIASAVKDYRERKTSGANSQTVLSNIIQLLKVYIPAVDVASNEKIAYILKPYFEFFSSDMVISNWTQPKNCQLLILFECFSKRCLLLNMNPYLTY
jgi:hypothetical protein